MEPMNPSRVALVAAAVLLFGAGAGAAQQAPDSAAARVLVTRQQLEDLLRQLEESSQSPAYSASMRARSRVEANLLSARLEQGDFQVGDRIGLTVDAESTLTDTFTVATGRVLNLPGIGSIPLAGVLHSELNEYLTGQIGRFVRNPVVRAKSLIRVAILGAVAKPGYYTVPTEALVSDVLMHAGGPTATAKLLQTRIERGTEALWEGERLQQAIAEGRTLDALSLQAGDRIEVPDTKQTNPANWAYLIQIFLGLPLAIVALVKIF
jgi:protein involved in polysaccharide export with SLBB domain